MANGSLRVLMLSKACIVGVYQRKLEEIARLGIDLLTLVPPSWKDERGETPLERVYSDGYRLESIPIRFNGNFHLHHYPTLGQHMRAFRPHIVHIDEEPYNAATWQALYHARRVGAKSLFFSWQNINRRYPDPFRLGERWVLNNVDYALMGTDSAAQVWREKGYRGPLAVIPQFGTDPALFMPERSPEPRPFTIGYFGRLVSEKGVDVLIEAASRLPNRDWRLKIVGGGPQHGALLAQGARLGVSENVHFHDLIPSIEMPAQYHKLDVLALPSRTQANWKEQFGRVLIEAMASCVAVVGSDSGAIPDVIGDAGLIFPEGDVSALTAHLVTLQSDAALRSRLAQAGRERALAHFTHQQIAAETVQIYREMFDPQS